LRRSLGTVVEIRLGLMELVSLLNWRANGNLGSKARIVAPLVIRYMGKDPSLLTERGDNLPPNVMWESLSSWDKAVIDALVELASQLSPEELQAYMALQGFETDLPISRVKELLKHIKERGVIE